MKEIIERRYCELRDGDVVVDKKGTRWHVSEVDPTATHVSFYLGAVAGEKRYKVTKDLDDLVKIERTLSHAEEVAKREAEVSLANHAYASGPVGCRVIIGGKMCPFTEAQHDATATSREAQKTAPSVARAAREALGAEVVAEIPAETSDTAAKATEAEPTTIGKSWSDMTPLEMRSHLVVFHTYYGESAQTVAELTEHHVAIHAGMVKSPTIPHVHPEA